MNTLSDSPVILENYINAGRKCLKNFERVEALSHFHKAMEVAPVPKVMYCIAKAHLEYFDYKKALPYLRNALAQLNLMEDGRLRKKCLKQLYNVYSGLNNFPLAMKVLEELDQTEHNTYWAGVELDKLKEKQARQEELAEKHRQEGLVCEERKNYEKAAACYTRSLQESSDGDTLLHRAFCYTEMGEYKHAIGDYTRFAEEIQDIPAVFIERGVCHFYLENFSEAFTDFERAKECAEESSGERTEADLYLAMARERFHEYSQLRQRMNEDSGDLEKERALVSEMLKQRSECQRDGEVWHAVSLSWCAKWNEHIRTGKSLPPIYNMDILALLPFSAYNLPAHDYRRQQIRSHKAENKDFIWVQDALWKHWLQKYGGIDVKRYFRAGEKLEPWFVKANVVFKPRRYWIKKGMDSEVVIYISKYDSYESIKEQCDKINEEFMKAANVNADSSILKSRIWVVGDAGVLDNLDERIIKAKTASKEFEVEIDGYLLESKPVLKDDIILLVELVEVTGSFIFKESMHIQPMEVCQEDLLSLLIPRGANGGAVGLVNNWNICYLNSALQCLSHCQELTKYFLSGQYRNELNYNNILGFNGRLAEVYAEFLDEMWKGHSRVSCAIDVKRVIAGKIDQFRGVEQHDSQEFLLHLLDGIHEDLNRVLKKPYVENSEANGRPDLEVSKEQWEKYLLRNESIVTDLFAGQYKSRVVCPSCSNVSITFDPFTILSIPLPSMAWKDVRLVPSNVTKGCAEVRTPVNETSSLRPLGERLREELKVPREKALVFAIVDNGKVSAMLNMDTAYSAATYNVGDLYAYECSRSDEDFIQVRIFCEGSSVCAYPLLIPADNDLKVAELKRRIFKRLAPIFSSGQNTEELYAKYVEDTSNPLYVLAIYNNRPLASNSFFEKRYVECEFCDSKSHKGNCILSFPYDEFTLGELKSKIIHKRSLILAVHVKKYMREFKEHLGSVRRVEISSGSHVALTDCFDSFVKEEQLDSENMWYCKKCQKDVQAKKRIELFRLPKILIVHLKRFKSRIFMRNYLTQSKNDEFVDYPVEGLDLSRFLKQTNDHNVLYNLFGVVMHYGILQGGHYTAACFNPVKNKWLEFDDSDVSATRNVVDRAGYVLFYRRVTPNPT